ncbi:MAG: response regulator transcription factor [Propionibacteriaceae bacterium]|jgi:DNA-binding NarL/FixJ family response regulator|nr:response regulator transcription factor [Propionibacteriaceae bacterium]
MTNSLKVFLVDDQELVRSGFRMLINAEPDMQVVGEAGDGRTALAALLHTKVDVVLMDIRMPIMDGVEATKLLTSRPDSPQILVLTTFDLDEYVFSALKAGASGFMLKDARPEDLLQAIRMVAAGDSVVAPSATRRLLEHVVPGLPDSPDSEPDPRLGVLTDRELEVLVEVAKGATNTEIASNLYMAAGTVKTHIGHLLTKLGARDRVSLVLFAYETGLVRP